MFDVEPRIKEEQCKATSTYITLLVVDLGSMDKVGSVHSPNPFILGGFILLFVVELQQKGTHGVNTFLMKGEMSPDHC